MVQAATAAGLDELAGWDGPAVAAVLPKGAAEFVHEPLGGPTLPQRLQVGTLPAAGPARPLGSLSRGAADTRSWRSSVPLAGAQRRRGGADRGGGAARRRPAEKLAAWLLRQTHLTDVA